VEVAVQRLITADGKHASMLVDETLDHSGYTPQTLHILTDLAARLPFEEAVVVASHFGLEVSKSELERLCQPTTEACREVVFERLSQVSEPLSPPCVGVHSGRRVMVLQLDGVRVLEKPEAGCCGGIEVKSVVLYPQEAPSERLVMADIRSPTELASAIGGLVSLAGVTPQDRLIGLGDGAQWVEDLLDTFCDVRITDVYHAATYVDRVMQTLDWSEARRAFTRRRFCRGEIDVANWLKQHLPDPSVWLGWEEDALNALRYLETRQAQMAYPSFKQQGLPIGSGMIEGLNKSVVASRMKRSGMQWSRPGAARMAAFRAFVTSKQPLTTFDTIRQRAFPPPSATPAQLQPS
jgi:hypothetical protein